LLVSGINSGLNAGINVLYSGTVAAAIEGAFFGLTSVAVSLEFSEKADYQQAAAKACAIIQQILEQQTTVDQLYNINIPLTAVGADAQVHVVPMATAPWSEDFERRADPRGRPYYWATGLAPDPPSEGETDLKALRAGHITVTPLQFDMTRREQLERMKSWRLRC
jgi:5'-nucleotidase